MNMYEALNEDVFSLPFTSYILAIDQRNVPCQRNRQRARMHQVTDLREGKAVIFIFAFSSLVIARLVTGPSCV